MKRGGGQPMINQKKAIDDAERRRILKAAAEGVSNRDIARRFGLGEARVARIIREARNVT
jgi:transposase